MLIILVLDVIGDAPYNCDKPLVGQNTGSNQTNCINTHYQVEGNIGIYK